MPPAPSADWISYGPSFVPGVSAICVRNYSPNITLQQVRRFRVCRQQTETIPDSRIVGNSYVGIIPRLPVSDRNRTHKELRTPFRRTSEDQHLPSDLYCPVLHTGRKFAGLTFRR